MKRCVPKSYPRAIASLGRRLLSPLAILAGISAAIVVAAPRHSRQASVDPSLTAHEWGTFTSIAGLDGQPVDWLPVQLLGKPELPSFVEHFQGVPKPLLRGTLRMETPVIYFYTAHETSVSVHVSFAKGFITEWYPHASHLLPSTPIPNNGLYEPHPDGNIGWDSITLAPNLDTNFPRGTASSHYYTARQTSATPLVVQGPAGEQHEKFLFYRGVSTASLRLSATVLPSGAIQLDNRTGHPIPAAFLFERRGDKLGYHIFTTMKPPSVLEPPTVTGTLDSLRTDLEDILVAQGLFRDEAHAMVETWGDSWFEEGSRLFYIVPRRLVDSILPLTITPTPAQLVRVFVGRVELVTPATEQSVEAALVSHDAATLGKYGRFLQPIFDIIVQKQSDPTRAARLQDDLDASFATANQ